MNSDVPLDYAVFQLSPRRSRCELFVSYDGATEKLASGLVKPFVSHMKVAEEQFLSAAKSIKLEVDRHKKAEAWFTKGTLERFVRFVGTPEILELVNTFNTEMSQLEAARKIYSQGPGDASGGDGAATTASEATKKELLRAIDVRLAAVEQDLSTACTHASAAGFNPDTVSELQLFADQFGAHRLSEACSKFLSLHQRRPEFSHIWKSGVDDPALRSSSESDMSIDDWATDSQTGSVLNQHQTLHPEQLDESRITSFQAANKSSPAFSLRRSSSREPIVEKDLKETNDKNEDNKDVLFAKADSRPPSTRSGPPARQLSVKERINLFETKQKDTTPPGSGSKPVVAGKSPELSRLPSDVSSAGQVGFEKAVLRRWSGASDMSIDLSGERKDADCRADTPTSAAASTTPGTPIIVEDKDRKGSSDTAPVLKPKDISASQSIDSGLKNEADLKKGEIQSKPVRTKSGAQLAVSSGASEEASFQSKLISAFERIESAEWKDHQNSSEIKSKASFGRAEDFPVEKQMTSLDFPRKMEQLSSRGKTASQERATFLSSSSVERGSEISAQNTKLGIPLSRYGDDDLSDSETYQGTVEQEDVEPRNRVPKSHVRTFQRAAVDMASSSASPVISSNPVLSQSIESEVEKKLPKSALEGDSHMARKDHESAEKQHDTPAASLEGSGSHSKKFQRHASPSLLVKKSRSRKDDDPSSSLPGATAKVIADIQQLLPSMSATPMEQGQRVRQSKGNQGLNNDLKIKADELEKLFAEHKLRGPGDQSSATRRSKPAEMQEKEASSVYRDSSPELSSSKVASMKMAAESSRSGNAKKSNASPVIQQFENQDYDVTPMQNTYNLGFSDESKGKLYHKYVQKRDAKLKEEWSLKGAEKEARMKAMHDSLERSRSEMKTKLAGSADRLDIHRRTEKLKSYSARSAIRREQLIHSFLSDDNEDRAEFEQDGSTGETNLADTPSRSAQNKRSSLSSNVAASTPRTSGLSASRSSAKASACSGGRRKLQSENPLAQSVPSLSGFKKENTKPSTTSSKGVSRPKVSRSKSSTEDALSFKEEKPWRPQHIRKSSATPLELNDLSLLNSEMVEHEDGFTRSMEGRTLPVKGDTYRYARSKASFPAETLETEDEELVETAKGEDLESSMDEDYASKDNGKSGGGHGSVLSANSGYENGDTLGVPSRANPDSVAEMPAMLPSAFCSMVSVLDSPGESPGSWHSRMHNPFQFQHEASDFDASVDSPIGSPAYWNQPDSDAARMRKKWGAAQKPNLASDSSHSQSRKDVTKGLKRFLKFGRKNRGADSLADWVSVTTSEGDDDTEDGRGDPANRSSDDLRKSRMGFSHYHPSDDGFSETDSFSEQDISKKTFFSFSTFRSKGSDSKPR